MQCQVCSENKKASYKCPKCRIRYCSVSCFQKHKALETCVEKDVEPKSVTFSSVRPQLPLELEEDAESDRLAPHILQRLGQSNQLIELLKNRHLRAMIKMLDSSENPADDMQTAMMEPIFVQFVDQLLTIVDSEQM